MRMLLVLPDDKSALCSKSKLRQPASAKKEYGMKKPLLLNCRHIESNFHSDTQSLNKLNIKFPPRHSKSDAGPRCLSQRFADQGGRRRLLWVSCQVCNLSLLSTRQMLKGKNILSTRANPRAYKISWRCNVSNLLSCNIGLALHWEDCMLFQKWTLAG